MKRIECVIMVEPVAKGRPRLGMAGGHAIAYTPKKTRTAEADIKAAIRQQAMSFNYCFDPKVPISMSATFYIEKPKSKPKKVAMPVSRPDIDNYAKTLMDACNQYVYPDDSQLTTVHFRKRYGTPPRIELVIQEEEV